MPFEFVNRRNPYVTGVWASVGRHGAIGISKGAIRQFELTNWRHVALGYDRELRRIAVTKVNIDDARALSLNSRNGQISAKSFLKYFDVDHAESRRFSISTEDGMLIIDLTAPRRASE